MTPIYFGAFLMGLSGMVILLRHISNWKSDALWGLSWVATWGIAAALTVWITGNVHDLTLPIALSVSFGVIVRWFVPLATSFGAGLLSIRLYLPVCGLTLLRESVAGENWSALVWVAFHALLLLFLVVSVIGTLFSGLSYLSEFCLRYQKRTDALRMIAAGSRNKQTKISIHVPCYAEPPHLLIATLNAISRLHYENFEVLVIDNNTKDENLWRPVQAHCQRLGERFRFFHVDPISGAKAGALNYALRHTASDAEIIAVIDADYIAEPDFVDKYVPLFEDWKTAFVQTSHDYHKWADNRFLSGTYYEYMSTHKIIQPAVNEYDAAYTVGTMCMVRKSALYEAGGWAEWALTEDSELAVRLHALGYTGHVFADTRGRGLIPETMDGVKRQQFRWSAGPIQQFMMHWRLYFGLGGKGRLTFMQKILELKHSFDRLPTVVSFIMYVPVLFVCFRAILNERVIPVSREMLALIGIGIIVAYLEKWIVVRRLGGTRFSDYLLCILMGEALRWTFIKAFIAPFFKFRLVWHRTDKFSKLSNLSRALASSRTETFIAIGYFIVATMLMPFASFKEFDYVALVTIGMFSQGLGFSATLAMAIISERGLLTKEPRHEPVDVSSIQMTENAISEEHPEVGA